MSELSRPKVFSSGEIQLKTNRVNKIIVINIFGFATMSRVGIFNSYERPLQTIFTFRINGGSFGLL